MKAPRVTGKALLAALQRGGFVLSHVRGSHYYLRHPNSSRLVVVPVHAKMVIPIGTFLSILRQAELTVEDVIKLLD